MSEAVHRESFSKGADGQYICHASQQQPFRAAENHKSGHLGCQVHLPSHDNEIECAGGAQQVFTVCCMHVVPHNPQGILGEQDAQHQHPQVTFRAMLCL